MKMHQPRWFLMWLIGLLTVFVASSAGCQPQTGGWAEKSQTVLGTHSQIRLYSEQQQLGEQALYEAFARVEEIEERMSAWAPDSQVATINRKAGEEAVSVTDDVRFVIETGLAYHEKTDGQFHIGLGTLTELWGISTDRPRIPTREEIEKKLANIDIETIQLSGQEIFISEPGTAIDLGGIAKGYAVDEAVRVLRDLEIDSGFVNFGGDVYALGNKPDGTPWSVGIKEPIPGSAQLLGRVQVESRSVVTSGDYERYVPDQENGERFHHILDPETGYPTDNNLSSVTVVADTTLEADILATASFVMGLEEGLRHIESIPRTEAIFVTKENRVMVTPGLTEHFELMNDEYQLH